MTHDLAGIGKNLRVRTPLRFEPAEELFQVLARR
jgi:hypothetical protein